MKESTDIDQLFAFFEPSAASRYQELGSLDARHDMTERWPLLGAMSLAGAAAPSAPPAAAPRDRSVWKSHVPELPPVSEAPPVPEAPPAAAPRAAAGTKSLLGTLAALAPLAPSQAFHTPVTPASDSAASAAGIAAEAPASAVPATGLSGLFSRLEHGAPPAVPEIAVRPPEPAKLGTLFRRLDGK